MGFHLRGYTFLCDQGFGSYGQNKFWVKYIKYMRVQRNRRARACAGGPPRARTPPHMTSEVMLSAFIRIYPHVGHRVCTVRETSRTVRAPCVHRACDVTHPACTVCNNSHLTPRKTTSGTVTEI